MERTENHAEPVVESLIKKLNDFLRLCQMQRIDLNYIEFTLAQCRKGMFSTADETARKESPSIYQDISICIESDYISRCRMRSESERNFECAAVFSSIGKLEDITAGKPSSGMNTELTAGFRYFQFGMLEYFPVHIGYFRRQQGWGRTPQDDVEYKIAFLLIRINCVPVERIDQFEIKRYKTEFHMFFLVEDCSFRFCCHQNQPVVSGALGGNRKRELERT